MSFVRSVLLKVKSFNNKYRIYVTTFINFKLGVNLRAVYYSGRVKLFNAFSFLKNISKKTYFKERIIKKTSDSVIITVVINSYGPYSPYLLSQIYFAHVYSRCCGLNSNLRVKYKGGLNWQLSKAIRVKSKGVVNLRADKCHINTVLPF